VTLSHRSKGVFNPPPSCLPGIERVASLKIWASLDITDKLAMNEHVRNVVLKCAQSVHIIGVLHRHGMNDQALQAVYTAVILAKRLYACSVWWGYATTDDRNRIEAVNHRGVRAGLYPADGPAAAQLIEN